MAAVFVVAVAKAKTVERLVVKVVAVAVVVKTMAIMVGIDRAQNQHRRCCRFLNVGAIVGECEGGDADRNRPDHRCHNWEG